MNTSVRLAMVGCSHRLSSLAVRERLAFTPEQTRDALAAWHVTHPDREAVLLSTCHRVEFYAATPDPDASLDPPALAHYLANFHNVPVEEIGSDLMSLEGEDVVRHLFRVAASLDSMVVGEAQILSQVKQAYEMANEIGSIGPVTHGAFQAAIRTRRRIAGETSLYRHRREHPQRRNRRFRLTNLRAVRRQTRARDRRRQDGPGNAPVPDRRGSETDRRSEPKLRARQAAGQPNGTAGPRLGTN